MADAAVSKVVDKLGDFLIQQSQFFFQDERSQLEGIKEELNWMHCLLEDADSKEASSKMAKKWVSEVRDLVFHTEDVIDNFIARKAHRKRRTFLRLVYALSDMWAKRKLGNAIEEIRKKLNDLYQKRSNYGIQDLGVHEEERSSKGGSLRGRRRTSALLGDSEVVGMEYDMQTLVELMTGGESCLCVVSIVGMAGLGKTTLARKIYNNEAVKKHFDCCAWICVSKEYERRDILLGVLTDSREMDVFGSEENSKEKLIKILKEMDVVQLKERLSEHLKRKKYLVVLDDVWDSTALGFLVSAFPNTNIGSRILLTTRHKAVVSTIQNIFPNIFHELKCLGEEESWKLFCMRTFPGQDMRCPRNLEQIGKEIVAKCHGLPLAIVVMGGLLSRKEKLEDEWEKVLRSQFVEGNPQIEEMLALSYKDLLSELKPCFLYFGNFPEDHEIYAEKLIRLWVAERFIKPSPDRTMEEVAEDYLDELIERSLVQVARRSCTGRVRSCRMHDLLRDFCVSKARESICLHVNGHSAPPSKVRRLALYHSVHGYFSLDASTTNLRSLSCNITAGNGLSKNQERLLFSGFKLLRVLDLYGLPLRELPGDISTLTLLRYLGCRRTDLECLPSSIGRLVNLETLDVTSSEIVQIPDVVWKMLKLRHFRVKGTFTECDKPPPGSDFPSNLQTLTHVKTGKWLDWLGKLPYLSKLGIWGDDFPKYSTEFSNAVPKLEKLRYLKLGEWDDCSIPVLPPLQVHQNLRKLFLHGKLEKLPKSHEFPPNLIKLTLRMTRLEHDPMPTLEKLNKLRILKLLDKAYSGKQMGCSEQGVCSSQGFPQLESLHVVYLNNLEEWRVDQGAMPSLQHLHIKYCMKLRGLPEGLQRRASLTIERKPPELGSNNEDGGPDLV